MNAPPITNQINKIRANRSGRMPAFLIDDICVDIPNAAMATANKNVSIAVVIGCEDEGNS